MAAGDASVTPAGGEATGAYIAEDGTVRIIERHRKGLATKSEVIALVAEVERLRRSKVEDIFARTAPVNVTVCPTCGGEGTVRLDG